MLQFVIHEKEISERSPDKRILKIQFCGLESKRHRGFWFRPENLDFHHEIAIKNVFAEIKPGMILEKSGVMPGPRITPTSVNVFYTSFLFHLTKNTSRPSCEFDWTGATMNSIRCRVMSCRGSGGSSSKGVGRRKGGFLRLGGDVLWFVQQ